MRKLGLTKARDRYDKGIAVGEASWPDLAKRLQRFKVTDETFEEYMAASQLDQLAIKDVGWFVGGTFDPPRRRKGNLLSRSVLTLDADHMDGFDVEGVIEKFRARGLEFAYHTSHKHSEDEPRYRFVFPLARDVTPEEYEPLARKVASWAGMDYFDDTTYQASRIMFWPSRAKDAPSDAGVNEGEWLQPDSALDEYEDWRDWASWPVSSREEEGSRRDPTKTAEDPYAKPGVIGAFNRIYSVPHAIVEFDLPYVPSGMGEDRYSYSGGSSADGAIYYEDDGHLYSWHESDPARGNRNAFDLVRLHRFGELDAGTASDTPLGQVPSQQAMLAWAGDLEPIRAELAAAEFDDLTELDEETGKPKGLTYDAIRRGVEARGHPLTDKERQSWVTKLAAARLTPAQESGLAAIIRDAHGDPKPSKQSILEELKMVKKQLTSQLSTDGHISDIEEDLMQAVLDEHYAGGLHIKRFNAQFWTYEGGVWGMAGEEPVRDKLAKTFSRLRKERPEDAMDLAAAVGESKTSAIVGALWKMFCSHVAGLDESRDPLRLMERRPPVVNCLNCELQFENGKWKRYDHRPELFLTTQVPIDFDKDAKCPEWDRFCQMLFHANLEPGELQRHLEEIGGYVIQPDRWRKSFVMFVGESNAGKSTVARVFSNLLKDAALGVRLATFSENDLHASADLVGKLMLLDDDFRTGGLLPEDFLKQISEEKPIAARPLYAQRFQFLCLALPVILSNHWPSTRGVDNAMRNRAVVFHLPEALPADQIDESGARARIMCEEELPGILNRFLRGFMRLHSRGVWDQPAECLEARDLWIRNSNPVAMFANDMLTRDEGGIVKASWLHDTYRNWMKAANPSAHAMGRNNFYAALRELGYEQKRHREMREVFVDISVPDGTVD